MRRAAVAVILAVIAMGATARSSFAASTSVASVGQVDLVHLNHTEPDGNKTDEFKVYLHNSGRAQIITFKMWGLNKGQRDNPIVIRADGGTNIVSPQLNKWSTRLRPGKDKVVTFTVRTTGADAYCAKGREGTACTNDPMIIVTDAQVQARDAARSDDRPFVETVRFLQKNRTQSNKVVVDKYRVTLFNYGAPETMPFTVCRQDSDDNCVAPAIIRVTGGATSVSRKDGKWRVRVPKKQEVVVVFTVKSEGVDKYCATDSYGKTCTDSVEPSGEG
jgi:hypothetical protein